MVDHAIKLTICYLVLLLVFLISLFAVSAIPSTLLKENIRLSIETFKNEGTYPSFGLPWRRIVLDNFTEPLMFNTAYTIDSTDIIKSALLNFRVHSNIDSVNQIASLEKNYLGTESQKAGYERYWHGYLTYLRPLLVMMPYSIIRILIMLILYGGAILFLYLPQ